MTFVAFLQVVLDGCKWLKVAAYFGVDLQMAINVNYSAKRSFQK